MSDFAFRGRRVPVLALPMLGAAALLVCMSYVGAASAAAAAKNAADTSLFGSLLQWLGGGAAADAGSALAAAAPLLRVASPAALAHALCFALGLCIYMSTTLLGLTVVELGDARATGAVSGY